MKPVALIVNWNAGAHLLECVRSLQAAGVADIVVADNASTDASLATMQTAEPEVIGFDTGANLGFGGGVNRAAAVATERFGPERPFLVLNPDVVVAEDAVDLLQEAIDADDTLGVVGPRVENPDGSLYPSARTFPNLVDSIGHAFLGMVWGSNPWTRRYRMLDWDHDTAGTVDWVSGSCFLIRPEAWAAAGGFDEAYFMYAEDVDLCWRVRRAGFEVRYEPAARVTHVQGLSTRQRPYRMIVEHHRSLLRFARKATTGPARVLLPVMALGLGVRTLLAWAHHRLARSAD